MRRRSGIAAAAAALSFYAGCDRDAAPPAEAAGRAPTPAATAASEPDATTVINTPQTTPGSTTHIETPSAPPRSPQTAGDTDHSPDRVPEFWPLQDARVGERTAYLDLEGQLLQYEIMEVDNAQVTTRVSLFDVAGRPLGHPALRRDSKSDDPLTQAPDRANATRSARHDTLQAAGRRWDATLYEDRWMDEEIAYIRRSWVSPLVPCTGLIRMELTGDASLEARLELQSYHTPPATPAARRAGRP